MLALVAGDANALQVVVAQLMYTLAVVADFTDRAALLGGHISNAYCSVGNSGNSPDDFIQCAVSLLSLLGGGLGVYHLGAHAFYRLIRGQLQPCDQGLDLAGGTGCALCQ